MRAELPKREPERIAWWKERKTYARRLKANEGAQPWILHDGPPYANGNLHMGHFLGMVLKDIFVKIALLDGRWAEFIPGWDMHGLPIELDTLKHLKVKDFHAVDPIELRAKCKERALHWLNVQRATRMRMGNFGRWERPYRTIDPEFEATIVEALADLAQANQLYKGLRSTLWCIHDETALAEAEIEYANKRSPSIFVRFTANDEQQADILNRFGAGESSKPLSVIIWTTTPWTLPSNVAIALKPDARYGLYETASELYLVATELQTSLAQTAGLPPASFVAQVGGAQLEGANVRHPFLDRDSAIVLADYVDLETGTGAVHTAPGHGADDFETGLRYNLPVIMPVDARGHFTAEAGPYAGLQVFAANPVIIEDLEKSGALVAANEFEHSYPHCWRCHNPVIFRATAQWFIAMDQNRLRARTIDAIEDVKWTPAWGENRMTQMLENHPEWCISRQRTWGTPIPAVICLACNESILDPEIARAAAKRFRIEGAQAWYRDDVASFLPAGFHCPNCRGTAFEKEKNIVDIWFESGVTHLAVLGRDGIPWPSDLVLEGGDQYRGWFRSSLITAVALKGAPPYKHVVSNGWVNGPDGTAMSKSLGNYYGAEEAMAKFGADVLRLWVASVEFTDDVRFGDPLVEQVSRVYRNIRNRVRFMISVLSDFTPADIVARAAMHPFDRLACVAADDMIVRVRKHYAAYGLHDAYLSIIQFEGEDLSGFYLDALKDPLYCELPDSKRRRSAQSALFYIFKNFMTVLAPLLSFTSEEAWQFLPEVLKGKHESVFDLPPPQIADVDRQELELWELVKGLRSRVASNDGPRDYDAWVTLRAGGNIYPLLRALGDDLREMLNVSRLDLLAAEGDGVTLETIEPAQGGKCQRCRKVLPLGTDPDHPTLCTQCAQTVRTLESK
ncbi:MAG: isoleucine--tRNA ligase, partial [Candidatus Eremiobacteraeota bacterium]|nr:isoleucine--tRNA ligase [Candidatus Eremiobacteraeota bacterium]